MKASALCPPFARKLARMDERKQINFTIVPDDKGDTPRVYANFCAISHTPFDFTLSFCEVLPLSESDIQQAQTTPPSVYDLRPVRRTGLDFLPVVQAVGKYAPLVDTPEHGQAIYWPMADDAQYRIDITAQGQLLPDEINEAAAEAVAQWGTTREVREQPAQQ